MGKEKQAKNTKKTQDAKRSRFAKFKNVEWDIVAFVVALIAGVGLITYGLYRNFTSTYSSMEIRTEAEVKKDVDAAYAKIDDLRKQRDEEYKNSAMSDRYKELDREITRIEGERANYEEELNKVQTGFYDSFKSEANNNSIPFIVGGVFLVIASVFIYSRHHNSHKAKILSAVQED